MLVKSESREISLTIINYCIIYSFFIVFSTSIYLLVMLLFYKFDKLNNLLSHKTTMFMILNVIVKLFQSF